MYARKNGECIQNIGRRENKKWRQAGSSEEMIWQRTDI